MAAPASRDRLHALDALRATMMLLGLVLHTASSYGVIDDGGVWAYKDTSTTFAADLTMLFIHVFRMPIFFVLAGFFAALLYYRRGAAGLLSNRFHRIAVPFVIGLLVLYPAVVSGFLFSNVAKTASLGAAWAEVMQPSVGRRVYVPITTIHLWFIYDLLYFYLASVLIAKVCAKLPSSFTQVFSRIFRAVVTRPLIRVVVLGLLTAITLFPMQGFLRISISFLPDPEAMLAYGFFFGFGWLFYSQKDLLFSFKQFAWTQTVAAAIAYITLEVFVMPAFNENARALAPVVLRCIVAGIATWMLFFGMTGLFLRHFDKPSDRVRYAVDASYWVYLVHLPFTIWIPGLLVSTGLSVWSKMAIVLGATAVIGFVSYDLFVRSTFIGHALNGRRYKRRLPFFGHQQ